MNWYQLSFNSMQIFCSYTSTPHNLSVVFSKFVSCIYLLNYFVVQLLSCVWLFLTAMDCSTPGFPVLHQLLEPAQTHVHWVGDAIQPSRPLSSPSPPAFSLSQHQSFPVSWLFTWGQSVGASASVSVLPMDIQGWFPYSPRDSPDYMWVWININCAYAGLSWRKRKLLMNAIYKIQMCSLKCICQFSLVTQCVLRDFSNESALHIRWPKYLDMNKYLLYLCCPVVEK